MRPSIFFHQMPLCPSVNAYKKPYKNHHKGNLGITITKEAKAYINTMKFWAAERRSIVDSGVRTVASWIEDGHVLKSHIYVCRNHDGYWTQSNNPRRKDSDNWTKPINDQIALMMEIDDSLIFQTISEKITDYETENPYISVRLEPYNYMDQSILIKRENELWI